MASRLIRVRAEASRGFPSWAEGQEFSVPETAGLEFPAGVSGATARQISEELKLRCAFTDVKPASSRLPVSSQIIPARIRSVVGSLMGRWMRGRASRWATFPGWPIDLSADLVSDLSGPSPLAGQPTPVVLTHDLDSAEGLSNLVMKFLDVEEKAGARSTSFVVPHAWPIDHGRLTEVRERGHEVGVHGFDHGNRTSFVEDPDMTARVRSASDLVDRYGVTGYRSPSLLRTRRLLRALAGTYRYDSSIPTSGGPFPVPNNGCATARPFRVEGIAELPLSLPRDGSLGFLGYSPSRILETWVSCADIISRSGGVVVLLTHCEARFSGNPAMLEIYRSFLETVTASDRFAWATPASVLERFEKSGALS
jgi:peptidoglycan/xylan/chitin deacetylase (PgdA/CDA1 family)